MSRPAWSPPEGIDWTRPALHIARECGVAVTTVLNWMRLNGLKIRPRGTPPGTTWTCANKFDASILDWRYQDIHLASIHGLCRERIRQLRKAAGLPASGSAAWLAAGGVVTNPFGKINERHLLRRMAAEKRRQADACDKQADELFNVLQ